MNFNSLNFSILVRVLGERLVCKLKSEEQSETPDFECSTIEKRRVNVITSFSIHNFYFTVNFKTEHLFYRFLQKVIELERKRTTNKPEFEKNLKVFQFDLDLPFLQK